MNNIRSAILTYQPQESTIDFENHLSILMFTSGCNFKCRYCHNPELLQKQNNTMLYSELGDILQYAKQNWIDAVSISGGEPTLDDRILDTVDFIKKADFLVKLDTQGSYPETLKMLLPLVDYVAMDYKMPISKLHTLTQTINNGSEITKSLNLLKESSIQYEIRTTICSVLHSDEDIEQMAIELKGINNFVLQPFVPRDNLPDPTYRKLNRTDIDTLVRYKRIFEQYLSSVSIRSFG